MANLKKELGRPMGGKEAVGALIGAIVVIYIGAKILGGSDEPPKPNEQPAPVAKLDYSRPVFTTEGGVICPMERALDQRMGHSLKDATQAALQTFGRTDALREVGCEVVHDGVSAFVKPPESEDVAWLQSTVSPVYYWRFNLRN